MLTLRESFALNVIRWVSCLMIVSCHILQGFGNKWAWVLNVGVQIFFFLSGFIYGTKRIGAVKQFYYKRFLKIYVPYFVTVTAAVALLLLFDPQCISMKQIVGQYLLLNTLTGNIPGLWHLWFMPVIAFCYCLLPFFQRGLDRTPRLAISISALLSGALLVACYHAFLVWIAVYFIGYLCGRYKNIDRYVLAFAALSLLWLFCGRIITAISVSTPEIQSDLLHAFGASAIFLTAFKLLSHISVNQVIVKNRGGVFDIPVSSSIHSRAIVCIAPDTVRISECFSDNFFNGRNRAYHRTNCGLGMQGISAHNIMAVMPEKVFNACPAGIHRYQFCGFHSLNGHAVTGEL